MQTRERETTNDETGRIEVITGCMFASKTEELISRTRRAQIAGQTATAFTPSIDDRYGKSTISSHDGREIEATVVEPSEDGMAELLDAVDEAADVVVIDEANLFDSSLVPAVQELADDGYRVIIAGLDQTFRGEPFEPLPELMALATYVEKRHAICEDCGQPATRTQRLINGEPAPADSPTIDVGGDEKYEARCRDCHTVPE